jgi:hypothetical protein
MLFLFVGGFACHRMTTRSQPGSVCAKDVSTMCGCVAGLRRRWGLAARVFLPARRSSGGVGRLDTMGYLPVCGGSRDLRTAIAAECVGTAGAVGGPHSLGQQWTSDHYQRKILHDEYPGTGVTKGECRCLSSAEPAGNDLAGTGGKGVPAPRCAGGRRKSIAAGNILTISSKFYGPTTLWG